MTTPTPEQDASGYRHWIRGRLLPVALGGVATAAILLATLLVATSSAEPLDVRPPSVDAKQLEHTVVTPHLEAPITPGKNVLWCSSFQLVWNDMCDYAGGDLRLQDEPEMVSILNKKAAKQTDVDPAGCLVMSGLVQDGVVDKIHRTLDRKFHGAAQPDLLKNIESRLPAEGFVAYAYLFRELPFAYLFTRFHEPLAFGPAKVASFGLRDLTSRGDDDRKAGQVAILDHKNGDDFIVKLKPKDDREAIILAKVAPAKTLQKTIEAVHSRVAAPAIKRWEQDLEMGESIVVPILDFDLSQQYGELCGKTIVTPGRLQGTPIALLLQTIRFRLDEQGAILKSEALAAAPLGQHPRRHLIFDKPFLILLERRVEGAQPYFALWVDNAEVLTLAR